MSKKNKKVLLIEPNYNNKFPPIGLMKLATYYRNLGGWDVVFYKGDLKDFVIGRIVDRLIANLNEVDTADTNWYYHYDTLFKWVKTRKKELLTQLPIHDSDVGQFVLYNLIVEAKDYYWKKTWEQEPEWDRIGVTTLFTFYWDITIETINFAKKLVKNPKDLMVGGVLASIQPNEIYKATGIKPHVGILNIPGQLDKGDTQIIDELELDYSILDEIDYEYPMANAYYRYTTKGCIRNCAFCAVKTLEPEFKAYIPLKETIDRINLLYGEQRDLLLMDNNVLASCEFEKIIDEIKSSGFAKGAKYIAPNQLEIAVRNLKDGINDRAYIRKTWKLIDKLYNSIKGDDSYNLFCIRQKYEIELLHTSTKENLVKAYEEIKDIYSKYHRPAPKKRIIDFNQGLDARLFTQEKADKLGEIAIEPVRIAFDDIKTESKYVSAIKMCVKAKIKQFSNYLLYNFNDTPEDLYNRLSINVDLCEDLDVNIYSFPMKYHPLRKTDDMEQDFSHNRDYIGKHWNRKYIRVIQAILNSTKGKVGRGRAFFHKAFGQNLEEYKKLLEMPETFIVYRFFFEWLDTPTARQLAKLLFGDEEICELSTPAWWNLYNECKQALSEEDWQCVVDFIHKNEFYIEPQGITHPLAIKLTKYYINYRGDILNNDSKLFKMKAEYDLNPTMELKWN